MEEDGEWVMVGKPTDRDVWSPSKMVGFETEEASKPLKLRSFEPAKHWTDALPIGNGRLGAMIWGAVASDSINLNGTSPFQPSHHSFSTTLTLCYIHMFVCLMVMVFMYICDLGCFNVHVCGLFMN